MSLILNDNELLEKEGEKGVYILSLLLTLDEELVLQKHKILKNKIITGVDAN